LTDIAIERVTRAMRLSPQDLHIFIMQTGIACAHFVAGRYTEALHTAQTAILSRPNIVLPVCIAATSAGLSGQTVEAHKAMAHLQRIAPDLNLSNLREVMSYLRVEDYERWAKGLRLVGLQE
jgi:hypothetical protein